MPCLLLTIVDQSAIVYKIQRVSVDLIWAVTSPPPPHFPLTPIRNELLAKLYLLVVFVWICEGIWEAISINVRTLNQHHLEAIKLFVPAFISIVTPEI